MSLLHSDRVASQQVRKLFVALNPAHLPTRSHRKSATSASCVGVLFLFLFYHLANKICACATLETQLEWISANP
jgi:hypothetical protein